MSATDRLAQIEARSTRSVEVEGAGDWQEAIEATAADVPALTTALRAVLDRHADDGGEWCWSCKSVWPCWTVRDIEEALR